MQSQPAGAAAGGPVDWDEHVPLSAACLPGCSLAALALASRGVRGRVCQPATLRWLAALRGVPEGPASEIECLEQLSIAEAVFAMKCTVAFAYGQIDLDPAEWSKVARVAKLLHRHPSLVVSLEAHCGLEAPTRTFAHSYSQRCAQAVGRQLAAHGIGQDRIKSVAYGNSRPLVWTCNSHSTVEGTPNRRVEMFLSRGGFEAPGRRAPWEYAVPPGSPPRERLLASDAEPGEDADGVEPHAIGLEGTAQRVHAHLVMVQNRHGQRVYLSTRLLQRLQGTVGQPGITFGLLEDDPAVDGGTESE